MQYVYALKVRERVRVIMVSHQFGDHVELCSHFIRAM